MRFVVVVVVVDNDVMLLLCYRCLADTPGSYCLFFVCIIDVREVVFYCLVVIKVFVLLFCYVFEDKQFGVNGC